MGATGINMNLWQSCGKEKFFYYLSTPFKLMFASHNRWKH